MWQFLADIHKTKTLEQNNELAGSVINLAYLF